VDEKVGGEQVALGDEPHLLEPQVRRELAHGERIARGNDAIKCWIVLLVIR
jgi:hypothetical protein